MTEYRRRKISGATYFFTVITYNRQPIFNNETARNVLRLSIETVQSNHPFKIDAMVLMPEHLHTIWSLPEDDDNYSMRWNLIKRKFTQTYKRNVTPRYLTLSKIKKRERGIWQRRFWEHCIRDGDDYAKHMDYIHYNPVKHGRVMAPNEWQWSTFHKYVELGWYPKNWGDSKPDGLFSGVAGEVDE